MSAIASKQSAAQAAWAWLRQQDAKASVIGIGCGSTVDCFIDALDPAALSGCTLVAAVPSSVERLTQRGFSPEDSNAVSAIDFYFDGADEINQRLEMIKGGGAALTGEKILASMARKFICLADDTKQVDQLGSFPLPIEVIPMARSKVGRELVLLGGTPEYRAGTLTAHGNVIIDVYNLRIDVPNQWEQRLNNIAGVVTNGIFARNSADLLVVGRADGSASWFNKPG